MLGRFLFYTRIHKSTDLLYGKMIPGGSQFISEILNRFSFDTKGALSSNTLSIVRTFTCQVKTLIYFYL